MYVFMAYANLVGSEEGVDNAKSALNTKISAVRSLADICFLH